MTRDYHFHVIATASPQFPVRMEALRAGLHALGDAVTTGEYQLPRPKELPPAEADAVVAALVEADALLVRIGTVSAWLLDRLPRLRVIGMHGVGVDQVDVAAASARGVQVTNTPGANAQAVVELTIALMIDVLRRVSWADRTLRDTHEWDAARHLGGEVAGRTVGLVGFGNIARGVARVCQALGARVIATRSHQLTSELDAATGIELLPLADLLAEADIVSLHLPVSETSRGLIDAAALAGMKPGAILINTARGPVVDQRALENALRSGRLAGAGLDVFDPEPPDFASPLFARDLPNSVVTPHMAASTHEALATMARTAAEDIARVLLGQPPRYPVNEPVRPAR